MKEFIDYADICKALEEHFGKEEEESDYFYFYEKCQDNGKLKSCKTYKEVEDKILSLYGELKNERKI